MGASVVKKLARECGFELVGITRAGPAGDAQRFLEWVAAGMAGGMKYLTDHRADLRTDPRHLLPSAKSVICLGRSYNPGPFQRNEPNPISKYARQEDYHDTLRRDMSMLLNRMQEALGSFCYKICIDTAPLLERSFGRDAGLGWIGKNTCLINQQYGSYIFLGEILVSLELESDSEAPHRCGTCTRCIDACPTSAIVPHSTGTQLDARRCISYFTIEHRGSIPVDVRDEIGAHVFGCDICQDVCPWNSKALPAENPLTASDGDLGSLARITPDEFRTKYRSTPIWRSKHQGFLRNVAVAMGNSGNEEYDAPLQEMAASADPVVAEHARWALEHLGRKRLTSEERPD